MLETLKRLKYGARVFLSKGGGQPETIDLHGRPVVIMQGGEGPPLVYLHSTLGESFMWFPFHAGLARHFHVLAPTHPGFGQSGGFDQIDTIEDMAFHYVELFDALGLDEVILGGVSLGGWIAAEFAVRWPERVRKLWLADAPGLWVPEQPLPDLFRFMQNRDQLRELLFHDPQGYMATLVIKKENDDQAMLVAYQNMTVLARLVWDRPYDPKLASRLRRVHCPTLLLWGDDDRLVPPVYGEAYRKYLPHAEWKLIKNCGHLPMFEKESEFVAALTEFCKRS
ncbi:MAG: alpha/beta hydrolase [Gemmataceae bacterium]|nr:alpha/beta hydrolase [Gemmataceae bacterium]